ncbi:amino acid ABC transporter permease [Actinomadura scrupuli]|uniref:amino acid ABC transporter permease n=1 Tax=Actinomadura scrupuli TaxID=559629 RepID=UPI003D96BCDA
MASDMLSTNITPPGDARASPPPPDGEDEILPIGTARGWGRWVVTLIVVFLLAELIVSVTRNPRFEWRTVGHYFGASAILDGLGLSLLLTVIVTALAIPLSLLVAGMRLSSVPIARAVAWAFVWFFRSVPALVQLLFWFNLAALYPKLSIGLPFLGHFASADANEVITPMVAAIVGLTLHEVAFMSEIFRAAILSVSKGQSEAAAALGMSRGRAFWHVTLPQAVRTAIPPVAGQAISLVKLTALVSFIGLTDLLYSVQRIYAVNFKTIPLLLVATCWYLIVTSIMSVGQYYLERYFARGHGPARQRGRQDRRRTPAATLDEGA